VLMVTGGQERRPHQQLRDFDQVIQGRAGDLPAVRLLSPRGPGNFPPFLAPGVGRGSQVGLRAAPEEAAFDSALHLPLPEVLTMLPACRPRHRAPLPLIAPRQTGQVRPLGAVIRRTVGRCECPMPSCRESTSLCPLVNATSPRPGIDCGLSPARRRRCAAISGSISAFTSLRRRRLVLLDQGRINHG
jgi:hypothetical protein